jgi:hypothetical protein
MPHQTGTKEILLDNFKVPDLEASNRQILALMTYEELSQQWRKRAVANYERIESYRNLHQGKISSKDLLAMHELAITYIRRIRRPLMEIIRSGNLILNYMVDIKFQTEKNSYIERNVIQYQSELGEIFENKENLKQEEAYQEIRVDIYHINPHDIPGQILLRKLKTSLAASLLLLDNYLLALDPYFSDKYLRRSLFFDIPDSHIDARKALKEIWLGHDKETQFYINLHRAFNFYHESKNLNEQSINMESRPYLEELDRLIQSTLAYEELVQSPNGKGLLEHLLIRVKHFLRNRRDELFLLRRGTTNLLSKIFGNTAGVFKSREGKLKNMPDNEYQQLVSSLRPLDILLEKTPFRLTDKFIPGYYGHVAIWVGTERELKELGVWELLPQHYKIAKERYSYEGPPFQQSVRSGKSIIEALRPGVDINSMRSFLNIDDLAILRPTTCPEELAFSKTCLTQKDKREYLLEAFKQIGKDYDFNFDTNTEKKIVCSEIAYRTFFKIEFETNKVLGKHSINPDHIVLKADDESDPFFPVLLYYEGKLLPRKKRFLREILKLLISKDYESVKNKISEMVSNK